MAANKFILKHHQLEVEYSIGITGIPALTYADGPQIITFKSLDITTDNTALGTLVSVPLVRSIDVGGERFGFYLPVLDVPAGQTVVFCTIGIYYKFSGPDSVPRRPSAWRCVDMHASAQSAIVPL